MKRPDSLDAGAQIDIAKYRLQTAQEDLDTANLTFSSGQYRAQAQSRKKTDPDPPNPGILGKTGQKKQSEVWRKLSGCQRPPQKSTLT